MNRYVYVVSFVVCAVVGFVGWNLVLAMDQRADAREDALHWEHVHRAEKEQHEAQIMLCDQQRFMGEVTRACLTVLGGWTIVEGPPGHMIRCDDEPKRCEDWKP